MSNLNLAGFLARSQANGPGTRAVVWVQGCPIQCKGCFNKASWSFSPNIVVTSQELSDIILAVKGIDGVTFSGGEPFAQAGPLAEVVAQVRDADLTVLTYSGYSFGELTGNPDPFWRRLLANTDLLVAGPYCQELACSAPLRGSSNQQIISLTDRISLTPASHQQCERGRVEFVIGPDGSVTTTGFPTMNMVRQITLLGQGV